MHINQIKQSKFLTRADVNPAILVTIRNIHEENVAKEGEPADPKFALSFDQDIKPMILNSTNAQIIAQILKSEETDDWIGKQIVLYDDPNVSFGGKLVGGIRVRAPRTRAASPAKLGAKPAKPAPAPEPELLDEPPIGADEDQIPF